MWDPYERYCYLTKRTFNLRTEEQERKDYDDRFNDQFRREYHSEHDHFDEDKLWRYDYHPVRLNGIDDNLYDDFEFKIRKQESFDDQIDRRNDEHDRREYNRDILTRNDLFQDLDALNQLEQSIKKKRIKNEKENDSGDRKVYKSVWGAITKTHLDYEDDPWRDESNKYDL